MVKAIGFVSGDVLPRMGISGLSACWTVILGSRCGAVTYALIEASGPSEVSRAACPWRAVAQ